MQFNFFDETNIINVEPINIINIKNKIFLIEKKNGAALVIEKEANIKRKTYINIYFFEL
jgi:hypothetical protein